jgi:hypothetical protein
MSSESLASAGETTAATAAPRRENWLNLPVEVAASLLAATTVLISLPPVNFPPWAIFIGWAGTFAAGGPNPAVLKKIWPVMVLGSTAALIIVLGFNEAAHHFSGWGFHAAQMVILFVVNGLMMATARLTKILAFVPGMFFGFASYFATVFGGFGPHPHSTWWAWVAVVPMNFLGPIYAWLNVKLSAPHGH